MSKSSKNPNFESGKPFVRSLPFELSEYFEILGKADSKSLRSGLVTLLPGKDVGWHSTGEYEELLIILDGTGKLLARVFEDIDISSGQIAYNPPGTEHNVVNTGTLPLKYIYVVAPAN